MIEGMIRSGRIDPGEIIVRDPISSDRITEAYGVRGADALAELFEADIIFVAVKPKDCPGVFAELAPFIDADIHAIVSVAAGMELGRIYEMLGGRRPVVRIMPNLNARYCKSATAVCAGEAVSEITLGRVTELLDIIGETYFIKEEHFGAFTALASCSPAFTYMYIDALARAAVRYGLDKKLAEKIAAQAVLGSAELVGRSPAHPYELVDMVCSPGGVTLEGVAELFESGFTASVMRAVTACTGKKPNDA